MGEQAVLARDEDLDRVEHYYRAVHDNFLALRLFPKCDHAVNRLFLNFCRHPGTALYKRMLEGSNVTTPNAGDRKWCSELGVPLSLCSENRIDSYVQLTYQKPL